MYVLDTEALIRAARDLPLPAALRGPLARRVRHTLDSGLGAQTTVVVVLVDDPEEALAREIGGSLLHNTLTGLRFGEPGFRPRVDWARAHPGCWELVLCVGDGGFAYIVLVEERSDPLGAVCRDAAIQFASV